MAEWLVLTWAQGVLRREPTRTAAVEWMRDLHGGQVQRRYCFGPGAYEYCIGLPDEDTAFSAFVEDGDHAATAGWHDLMTVPDLYPFHDAERRFDTDTTIDRGALLKEATDK